MPLIIFLLIFFFLNTVLSFFVTSVDNKTPFECGYESSQMKRGVYSLRFFSVTVIFLIFDMEVCLILPLPFFWTESSYLIFFVYFLLGVGIYLEWNQGGLDWV